MLVAAIAVLWMLIGCQSAPEVHHHMLTAADNGRALAVATGDSLTVTLDSNPTTGYLWELVEVDAAVLQYLSQEFESPAAGSQIAGAGGTETWRFTARAAGSTTLLLEYRRPWEPDQPAGSFSLAVTVN